jgi:D-beta-D-heptose 7-phosphate kinase/D-beta-D-heptose 1-phosphate adenosyltransferase
MSPLEILEKIQGAHIAVVGDAMVDRYEFGRAERICPEAPVPIFIPERSESRPGGAANVAQQLIVLGCQVQTVFAPEWCIKTRYMAGQQLVLRVDRDRISAPGDYGRDVARVAKQLAEPLRTDAFVLSDYSKGWLSHDMCQAVIAEAKCRSAPVIVDPKGPDWRKFAGCDLICPSTSDGLGPNEGFPNILWKRGAAGMDLISAAGVTHIPTVAKKVADVTGAGDVVVAVVAAALAVGASQSEAATLAALAAGFTVGEVGTTVCPIEKLKELINASH